MWYCSSAFVSKILQQFGSWWWSSDQHACLFQRFDVESRLSLSFSVKFMFEKKENLQKEAGVDPVKKVLFLFSWFSNFHKQHKLTNDSIKNCVSHLDFIVFWKFFCVGVVLELKSFVLTEAQTHSPGCSTPMFGAECFTTQLSRHPQVLAQLKNSTVVNYDCKMFAWLATGVFNIQRM